VNTPLFKQGLQNRISVVIVRCLACVLHGDKGKAAAASGGVHRQREKPMAGGGSEWCCVWFSINGGTTYVLCFVAMSSLNVLVKRLEHLDKQVPHTAEFPFMHHDLPLNYSCTIFFL
jgi:hypothetical protein